MGEITAYIYAGVERARNRSLAACYCPLGHMQGAHALTPKMRQCWDKTILEHISYLNLNEIEKGVFGYLDLLHTILYHSGLKRKQSLATDSQVSVMPDLSPTMLYTLRGECRL